MMNQPPYSNTPLIVPQNPQMVINPGYPAQNQIYTNPAPIPNQNQYIPPQTYQLIPNQIPVPQLVQPPVQLQKSLDMTELYEDLGEITQAEVWKYFQGGVLGIGAAHKYRVKIKFPGGTERNIFIGKRSSSLFHNNKYNFEIRIKYIPRDCTDEILNTKDFEKRHFDIDSNQNFSYKPRIYIKNVENNVNIMMGTIEQPRCCNCCCKDANFEIYPQFNVRTALPRYFVTTDGCQCAYCCCEGCCCEETGITFQIYDPAKSLLVGNINKLDFNRERADFLKYNIELPLEATSEEKLFIIFTAIAIDNVEYRILGGHIK